MTEDMMMKLGGGGFAAALLYLLYLVGMRVVAALDRVAGKVDGVREDVGELRSDVAVLKDRVGVEFAPGVVPAAPVPRLASKRAPTPAHGHAIDRPWDRDR